MTRRPRRKGVAEPRMGHARATHVTALRPLLGAVGPRAPAARLAAPTAAAGAGPAGKTDPRGTGRAPAAAPTHRAYPLHLDPQPLAQLPPRELGRSAGLDFCPAAPGQRPLRLLLLAYKPYARTVCSLGGGTCSSRRPGIRPPATPRSSAALGPPLRPHRGCPDTKNAPRHHGNPVSVHCSAGPPFR